MKRLSASLVFVIAVSANLFGEPFKDSVYSGGAQQVPGPVFCAYYDVGGEGVAYHDGDVNQGSGKLNPADGSYLNEFRKNEGPDISYTKQYNDLDSPCNDVTPPLGLLYVGWNDPGEWFTVSVETAQAGNYVADLLYTAQRDATISIGVDGGAEASIVAIPSTFDEAETVDWRQWHHWNVVPDAVTLHLPKGVSTLRIRIETGGNLNLATLAFREVGMDREESDILKFNTPAQ